MVRSGSSINPHSAQLQELDDVQLQRHPNGFLGSHPKVCQCNGFNRIGLTNLCSTASLGLGNGGSAGLLYTNLATWIGFLAVYASLGEQGSMAPTSGGSSFCPLLCLGVDYIRAIPLGFRVFESTVSEVPELHRWYVSSVRRGDLLLTRNRLVGSLRLASRCRVRRLCYRDANPRPSRTQLRLVCV